MSASTVARRWGIAGHDRVVETLDAAVDAGRVAHAYLLTGPEGVGRTALALALAQALNCTAPGGERPCGGCDNCRRIDRRAHPDVTLVDFDWQNAVIGAPRGDKSRARQRLSIDAVRLLRQDIVTRPVLGRWKVQIVDDAGMFSDTAPDAFLKTLEEPPPFAVIILIADSPDAVSETIRSRCQPLALGATDRATIAAELRDRGLDADAAERLARVARGRIAWALGMANDPQAQAKRRELVEAAFEHATTPLGRVAVTGALAKKHSSNRDATFELLDLWTGLWRDALLHRVGLSSEIAYPEVADRLANWAAQRDVADLHRAIWATRRCLNDLNDNVQARIALQAMVLQWPR